MCHDVARHSYARKAMGTDLGIVLYSAEPKQAAALASNAFALAESLEAILSDYRDNSDVRRLPRLVGEPQAVNPHLWAVLEQGQALSAASDGAFDMTVGPLVMAWRHSSLLGRLPDEAVLAKRRAASGWQGLSLHPANRTVTVTRLGMRLDLGGIAKGYIADQMLALLAIGGCTNALIDAGGDLVLGGPPPGREGWEVKVAGSDKALQLSHCGVATSGASQRFLEVDGMRYSHIIDPRTGLGVTHPWQVTVIAPNGLLADAWASACSVLGKESGDALIRRYSGLRAIWTAVP